MRFRRKTRSDAEQLEVERAMQQVAADDNAETRSALFKAVLNAKLVAAIPEAPTEQRSWTAGDNEQIDVVMLPGDDGPVWPIFTSVEKLLEWKPEGCGYAALPARALVQMAAAIAESAGLESGGARELTFMRADGDLRNDLASGAGDLVFARRSLVD